jgi:hypothetical protein
MPFSLEAGETYLTGFVQTLYGGGLDDKNPTGSDFSVSETRLQVKLESISDAAEFFGRLDFTYDEHGDPATELELREGYALFRIGRLFDIKVGRQIATWGTGDLIFINDLFAKDYISFFNGRDDQYLKAPQNALRISHFNPLGTFTLIYTPRFAPNRIPIGERFSYYNPLTGMIVGGEHFIFEAARPEAQFENGELAVRYSRYVGPADVALYFYHGFYKNPVGMNMTDMTAFYPELNVFGASVRSPFLGGIIWAETGYYHSRDDKDGDHPFIPNSQVSSLIGFERQINSNLTANIQYQNKIMLNYQEYTGSLGEGMDEREEYYHLLTSRITHLFMMETVRLSAFAFYSPSDEDFYGRFSISYNYTDNLILAAGANIFTGKEKHTDFGTFQRNDNVYVKATYGF